MEYLIIANDSILSTKIITTVREMLTDNDSITIKDDGYQIDTIDHKDTMLLNTVDSNKAKEICLKSEDLNIITLDFTDMFIGDSTIPIISDKIEYINSNSYIYRVPNNYVVYLLHPIKKIIEEYKIKNISIYLYDKTESNTRLENIISSDIATVLDYSEVITTSMLEFSNTPFIHIVFEFFRPFNINTVVEELSEFKPIKVTRDLSVNSGLNVWLANDTTDGFEWIFTVIRKLKEHIK